MRSHLIILLTILCMVSCSTEETAVPDVGMSQSFNFGVIDQQQAEALKHTFVLTNQSDTPIHILDVIQSCGCTEASVSNDTIQPGDECELDVVVDWSDKPPGNQSARIVVKLDGLDSVVLSVQGLIKLDYALSPNSINFGRVELGQSKTRRFNILSFIADNGVDTHAPISVEIGELPDYIEVQPTNEKPNFLRQTVSHAEYLVTIRNTGEDADEANGEGASSAEAHIKLPLILRSGSTQRELSLAISAKLPTSLFSDIPDTIYLQSSQGGDITSYQLDMPETDTDVSFKIIQRSHPDLFDVAIEERVNDGGKTSFSLSCSIKYDALTPAAPKALFADLEVYAGNHRKRFRVVCFLHS